VSTSVWVGQVEGFPCASDGLACTGDVCDAEGACIHPLVTGCLIGGACIALHALDPEDACRWCDPTLSTDSYSVRQGCGLAPDAGLPDGAAPDAGDATDVGRCGPGTHLEDGYCVVDPGGGKGGCDCRAVGEGAGPWSTALLWLGVLLLVFRRRRRAVNQDR
jgi:MYXO-CTERM domain-containing protein